MWRQCEYLGLCVGCVASSGCVLHRGNLILHQNKRLKLAVLLTSVAVWGEAFETMEYHHPFFEVAIFSLWPCVSRA
jgi:hypothetical protein